MQKITNKSGEEIEVYTKEDLESQRESAIEQYKEQNPDQSEDMKKLQEELEGSKEELEGSKEELEKSQEELKKAKDKDLNFSSLRNKNEKAEDKIKEIESSIDEKISTVKKEVLEGVMKDHFQETVSSLAGDDEELKKKIEFHYNRISDVPTTKSEMTKKLTDSWTLATQSEKKDEFNSRAISSSGYSAVSFREEKSNKMNAEEKEFVKKLGRSGGLNISDEDIEKYGK